VKLVAVTALLLAFALVSFSVDGAAANAARASASSSKFCLAVHANGESYPVRVLAGDVSCRTARDVLRHFLRSPDRSFGRWRAFYGHGQDIWSVTAFVGSESAPRKLIRAFNPS